MVKAPTAQAAPAPQESPRSELRRMQILDAAADCFRTHGFHGASIAQISRTAGMSAGHIYHYFENKEAIIAAIVERDLDHLHQLSEELRSAPDMLSAMLHQADNGVSDQLDPHCAALKLEILAEASRNPAVAATVHQTDRACLASLDATLRVLKRSLGQEADDAEIRALSELLATMFEGLTVRAVRNPALDKALVSGIFRKVILELIARQAPSAHRQP